MKRILALGLAAALSAASVVALPGIANAHSGWGGGWGYGYGYPRPPAYHPYGYYYDPGPAIVAGAIFGAVFGALPGGRYGYRHRVYAGSPSHDDWCSWRYRTYNPVTNTYFARRGVSAACVSPYQ